MANLEIEQRVNDIRTRIKEIESLEKEIVDLAEQEGLNFTLEFYALMVDSGAFGIISASSIRVKAQETVITQY